MKFFKNRTIAFLLILIAVSIPVILPYFHDGFFPTHDGEWAVVRLSDMYREVKDGQIPPRFSGNLNFGYGYPLFQYAYPLPYYLGLPPFLLHFGLVNSIKLLFALSVPLSGVAMFFAAREIWKNDNAGIISGLLYIYFPYRMVDLYVRGSLGESLASVFFPIILLCIKRLSQRQSMSYLLILSISMAALILSHNIMAVLFGIIIFIYLIYLFWSQKRINTFQILIGIFLGLGISAFFWLPAILEKNLILLSKIPIADRSLYYVSLSKFLFSPFGYGTPTENSPFTYQIGVPQITIGIVACFLVIKSIIRRTKIEPEIIIFSGLSLFFVFMMLPMSSFIWEQTPLLKEINFPWTSLLPLGFILSLLGGKIFAKSKQYFIIGIFICLFAIVLTLPFARPESYVNRGDGFYFTNDATTTSSSELMPLTVKSFPSSRPEKKVEIIDGDGRVLMISDKSQKKEFSVSLTTPSEVRLNTIYFPGWHWYRDAKELPITFNNAHGLMEAKLPQGDYMVKAIFQNTPVRLISDIISVLFICFVLLAFFVRVLKEYSLESITKRYLL